jgi:hypothetical protein
MIGWTWLLFLPAVFGLPLAAIGIVVLLCEWSWEKPAGTMGSRWLLACSAILCLPAAIILLGALWR